MNFKKFLIKSLILCIEIALKGSTISIICGFAARHPMLDIRHLVVLCLTLVVLDLTYNPMRLDAGMYKLLFMVSWCISWMFYKRQEVDNFVFLRALIALAHVFVFAAFALPYLSRKLNAIPK